MIYDLRCFAGFRPGSQSSKYEEHGRIWLQQPFKSFVTSFQTSNRAWLDIINAATKLVILCAPSFNVSPLPK